MMHGIPGFGPIQPNRPSATIFNPVDGHRSNIFDLNVGPRPDRGWDPFGLNPRPNLPSAVIKDAGSGRTERVVYDRY